MVDTDVDGSAAERTTSDGDRVLVLNPVSGTADHATEVRSRAADHGFEVRTTEGEGDAVEFAREAAEAGASLIAAAGGDGTLNEVVRGIVAADALEDVRFGVVPAGTGNNFAANVGIEDIAHAFRVIEDGEVRRIDLGVANDRPFLNSCVAGLTADASAETDSDLKSSFGPLAYVLTTMRHLPEFDGLRLRVETEDVVDETVDPNGVGGESGTTDACPDWEGRALLVMIGNARRFPRPGQRSQADAEDGLLDVTIVEGRPTDELFGEGGLGRLLGGEATPITRLRTPALSIEALDDEPVRFSLDGEIVTTPDLDVSTRRRRLSLFVGEAYDPDPPS